ncbi:MAG TPA: OmpA family protein [Bacteroidales bacterium]|nr:OmpA family protein [Bacteroidales bacterium]
MKTILLIGTISLAFIISEQEVNCQLNSILKKTKKETTKSINKNIDKGLDNLFNKDEENKAEVKEIDQTQNSDNEVKAGPVNSDQGKEEAAPAQKEIPKLVWAKYDFVPGDKIIFEDNMEGEENGEFPSRWDLWDGTTENASFGGENVIMFRGGTPAIFPYLKNPKIDYLPEVFTIEFDLYLPSNTFTVSFYDRKNQGVPKGHYSLDIQGEGMNLSPAGSKLPGKGSISKKWAHISIAYTSGKMKAYIDETRLINIPHLSFNPTGITLYASSANDNNLFYIKNFRIAEGGVKYYDRFLQDGKIVSNGIRFDVGKATLRPESMGVLNEIYKMLSEHPDIKVSIEGHTDSAGDGELNKKLSEERALTVLKQLQSMGINEERLTSKGYGESKPVETNDTPEGKAANRRVEFIKI